MTVFEDLITAHQRGDAWGIPSICSAHPTVLETAFRTTEEDDPPVLIESTCNQVNQFGGYTGMTPADFVAYVRQLARDLGYPDDRLILGGDHLGPEVWGDEPAGFAMEKAQTLVRDYVDAGYLKIHLDASMKLGGDPPGPLSPEIAADRSAVLAQAAEDAFKHRGSGLPPRYVIGTEVPVPGGARRADDLLHITATSDAAQTLEISRRAFLSRGLDAAWERAIALVVHPGVEFGHRFIQTYDRSKAAELSRFITGKPWVYEAHSTDYQEPDRLRQMVEDHFAVLKVGPALTFAYREAVFALAAMENELCPSDEVSNIIDILDQVMLANPRHWDKYYLGDGAAQAFARKYSYSDRIRYYWAHARVQTALTCLFSNLGASSLPLSLVSQFLPIQYGRVREGTLSNDAQSFLQDKINDVLRDYRSATAPR